MQRNISHCFIIITVILLSGCIAGGSGNVKQAYYDIRTTDGISTGEAKISALYHANLDRIFGDVSEDALSAQILSQGNYWRVTLVQNTGRNIESATYLVNKINGNTKSANELDAPVNFTSGIDNKVVTDELSDIEKRALTRHAKLKERNMTRNNNTNSNNISNNNPINDSINNSINNSTNNEISAETLTANNEVINQNKPSISDSRSIRAFPPRRADGKVNMPGIENTTRVNIDEESLVTILSSNNRITKKTRNNKRERNNRGVTRETLNASRTTTTTERVGGDAARALQSARASIATPAAIPTTSPAPTPVTPAKPANTNLAINKSAPTTKQAAPATQRTNSNSSNRPAVSRLSSGSRRNIGPRYIDAFPRSGASQPAQLAIETTLGNSTSQTSPDSLPRNTFNNSLNNNALQNNQNQPARPVFDNSNNTTASQDHPVYRLKLLNEGFDAELSNRIQLKPDHDMDFSDDDLTNPVTDSDTTNSSLAVVNNVVNNIVENVADAIANEALTHNVSPATILTEPGETVSMLTQSGRIDTRSITQPEPDTNTLGSITPSPAPDTQIASLGKPPSLAEPFFITRGDTVVFKGAASGNKAILRRMEELVQDGFSTTVTPIMINGNKIQDEAKFYELPPGSYTITMRCDSIFTSAGSDKHYSYETEIKVAFVNSHEYILEAQTYRFDNHIECASDIYDIRDSR